MIVQMSGLDKGNKLAKGNVNVLTSLLMCDSNDRQRVILKEANDNQSFNAEVNSLNGYLRGHGSFRQLINIIPDQKIMVYEYLADNLHNVLYTRPQRKLEEEEVKRVTKVVLQGLATMHEKNLAHTGGTTDIKSDNIVVDFDQHGTFSRIKLIDLGDSVRIDPTTNHPFTHPTCRAPEGLFGLPWTTKVDLWALGTLVGGNRDYCPPEMAEKDEIYHVMILTLQCAYFGPFPNKYVELSDEITTENLDGIEGLVTQRGGRRKYRNTLVTNMSKETVSFLDKFMKLDPRDRPLPQELLQDQWLSGVVD
ncbi:MAG: hypothetical protein Q9217_000122 [Psora testacea]